MWLIKGYLFIAYSSIFAHPPTSLRVSSTSAKLIVFIHFDPSIPSALKLQIYILLIFLFFFAFLPHFPFLFVFLSLLPFLSTSLKPKILANHLISLANSIILTRKHPFHVLERTKQMVWWGLSLWRLRRGRLRRQIWPSAYF